MPRNYVNNAMNRSLGRVGMSVGSAPVSSGSRSTSYAAPRAYVDNSYNRSHGRVGMEVGTATISSNSPKAQSPSPRTYVDNSYNRNHGRVGMEVGTATISSNSPKAQSPSPRTYVDNSYNRNHGRVGMEVGTATISSNSPNAQSPSPRTYVDNSYNRNHGRVGKTVGTATISSNSPKVQSPSPKTYVDNRYNRACNRVGKPLGTAAIGKQEVKKNRNADTCELHDAFNQWENVSHIENEADYCQQFDYNPLLQEKVEEMLERMILWEKEKDAKSKEFSGSIMRKQVSELGSQLAYTGPVIKFEAISLEAKIGHGGFGDIYSAIWNGRRVAVKKLRVQRVSQKRLKQFIEEINIFHRLQHKNIAEFYGGCTVRPNLCIVMELMEESLYDKLHIKDHQFTMDNKMVIIQQFSAGLEYLHSMNVAHCDIKSKNILVSVFDGDDMIQVKITDFGLSLMKNDSETSSSEVEQLVCGAGTPRYSAPEVLRGEMLSQNEMKISDIYSFGLVVHEIFTEEEPFDDLNVHQLRQLVGHKGKKLSLAFFDEQKQEQFKRLGDLLSRCWSEPKYRPQMHTICQEIQ